MKKFRTLSYLLIIALFALTGCKQAEKTTETSVSTDVEASAATLSISAASSLTEALEELKTLYAEQSKDKLQFNFGSSGALQKQIEEGAPCDLFISAALSQMDALEKQDLLVPESRINLLGNDLVLISSKEMKDKINSSKTIAEDPQIKSIAIGVPESVPSGKYAKQTLMSLGLWDQAEPKLVLAKDVKQVLEYVETGNADCGFVYKTDAQKLDTAVLLEEDFSKSHDPILYPMALLKASENQAAAKAFYDFLKSDAAKEIFVKYGFNTL